MQTTITLDDDVRALLERHMCETGRSLDETVNELLRSSLGGPQPQEPRKKFEVRPWPMGSRLDEFDGCVQRLLEDLEGPDYR